MIRTILPDGTYTDIFYNGAGEVIAQRDALGRETKSTYNQFGQLTKLVEPDPDGQVGGVEPRIAISTYDAVGNVIETKIVGSANLSATDRATSYFYDSLGRVTKRIDPTPDPANPNKNPVEEFFYDAVGNVVESKAYEFDSTDIQTMLYAYDSQNRVLKVTQPDFDPDIVTAYVYDNVGNRKSVTDPKGHTTNYDYDNINRLITETLPDPGTGAPQPQITYTYDTVGNLRTHTLKQVGGTATQKTEFEYDSLDRVIKATEFDFNGSPLTVSETAYDDAGNVLSRTDPLGRTTRVTYDNRNRVVRLINALGAATTIEYYANSQVYKEIDAAGNATVHQYDNLDRATRTVLPDPDGSNSLKAPVLRYEYDSLGGDLQLTYLGPEGTPTDEKIRKTEYAYDKLHRITQSTGYAATVDDDDDLRSTHTYDVFGNLISEKQKDGGNNTLVDVSYVYDKLNRLIATTESDPAYVAPTDVVVDDTQATFEGGGFSTSTDSGAFNQSAHSGPISSNSKATWVVSGLKAGADHTTAQKYDVFVTWPGTASAAFSQYRVFDQLGNQVASTSVAQYDPVGNHPNKITSYGVDWVKIGSSVSTKTGAFYVVLESNITGSVIADAIRIAEVGAPAVSGATVSTTTPQVFNNNLAIATTSSTPALGDGTDFGRVAAGTVRTFTVRNNTSSAVPFATTAVTLSGTNAADFKIIEQPAVSSLAAGASATFKVQFNPSGLTSARNATVTVTFGGTTPPPPLTFAIRAQQGLAPRQNVYAYDDNSNLVMEELRSGGVPLSHTEYRYDALNRPTEDHYYEIKPERLPINAVYSTSIASYNHTVTTYDVAGNIKTFTDEANRLTKYDYDALNRQTILQEFGTASFAQTETKWEYDAASNVISESTLANQVGTLATNSGVAGYYSQNGYPLPNQHPC